MALITCLGAFFCLHDIGSKSLWGDEINVVQFVTGERDMQKSSGNALGYFELIEGVRQIGKSDTMLRLPAAAFGIISLPLIMWILSEMFTPRIGLGAGLLLAVAPTYVAHAQQVHAYSAFCGLASGLLGLLWLAYHRGGRSWWLAWSVLIGVSMWIHLYTVFLVAAQLAILVALIAMDRRWRRPTGSEVRDALLLTIPPVLISFPLIRDWILPLGLQLLQRIVGKTVEGGHFAAPAFALDDIRIYRRAFVELTIWRSPFVKLHIIVVGLAILGLVIGLRRYRRATLVGLLWITLPLPLILFFSYKSGIDFGSRRLIFALPVLLAFTATGLDGLTSGARRLLPERWSRALPATIVTLALCGVLAFLVSATALHHYYQAQENADRRTVARFLELAQRPGDRIMAWRTNLLGYYYRGTLPIEDIRGTERIEREMVDDSETHRIWYVRPYFAGQNVGYLQPIEPWFDDRGAVHFPFGGHMIVSMLTVDPESPDRRRELAELMVALKPDRPYSHHNLALVLNNLNVDPAARRRETNRGRRAVYHPLIPWLL